CFGSILPEGRMRLYKQQVTGEKDLVFWQVKKRIALCMSTSPGHKLYSTSRSYKGAFVLKSDRRRSYFQGWKIAQKGARGGNFQSHLPVFRLVRLFCQAFFILAYRIRQVCLHPGKHVRRALKDDFTRSAGGDNLRVVRENLVAINVVSII